MVLFLDTLTLRHFEDTQVEGQEREVYIGIYGFTLKYKFQDNHHSTVCNKNATKHCFMSNKFVKNSISQ